MVTANLATYNRVSARGAPTMIEGFIDATAGDMAGTPLAAGATVVAASDIGVGEDSFDAGPWEGLGVSAEDVSLVVPAGAGAETDEIKPLNVMAMAPGGSIYEPRWTPGNEWASGTNWVPGASYFSGSEWVMEDKPHIPARSQLSGWLPAATQADENWIPDDPRSLQVYVTSGEEPRPELFNVGSGRTFIFSDRDTMIENTLESDEEVSLENAVLAAPLDVFPTLEGETFTNDMLYDAATPAPIDSRTFSMSVMSVPGTQYTPGEEGTIVGDTGRVSAPVGEAMIGAALGGSAEESPGETTVSPGETTLAPDSTNLLSTETEIRSFVGSVEGPGGVDFGVGIHVADVETQGVGVVAVGTHNWPIGPGQQSPAPEVGGLLERAREFFALAVERLDFEGNVEHTTPTPTPAPGPGGDRLSETETLDPITLSTSEGVQVSEQSAFSFSFQALTDCAMDVFVVPEEPFRAFVEGQGASGSPDELRDGLRSLARDHTPADLRFFEAASGSGTAELSAGVHYMVFTRVCDLGTRTAVEFTAEVETGSFDDPE